MCSFSEEGNTDCLKIFDSNVKRFKSSLKVPQIGWNNVFDLKTSLFNSINENEYMYLVHSYYVPLLTNTVATSNYGINYSTAIKKITSLVFSFILKKVEVKVNWFLRIL